MKKMLLIPCLLAVALQVMAKFAPNTKWPYIYENFTDGVVYSTDPSRERGKP